MGELGGGGPGGGGAGLGEVVAGVHRPLDTAPERRFDRDHLHHPEHVDDLLILSVDQGDLAEPGRKVESADVAFAVLENDLIEEGALKADDAAPFDGNGARGIGRDGEPSPLELLHLAGDAVAVVEKDYVGLGPRPRGCRHESQEYEKTDAGAH